MKKNLKVLMGLAFSFGPMAAFAATCGTPGGTGVGGGTGSTNTTLTDIICKLIGIIDALIPLLMALGLLYFIWGVISYVIASDEEAKTKGRDRMIYGIIGFAVIIGVWGLTSILVNTFGLSGGSVTFPTVQGTTVTP